MANTVDELMRESHIRLSGPNDRRIQDIITYMRQDRAKQEMGGKRKRSEVSEEMNPELEKAVKKLYPAKPALRRF